MTAQITSIHLEERRLGCWYITVVRGEAFHVYPFVFDSSLTRVLRFWLNGTLPMTKYGEGLYTIHVR